MELKLHYGIDPAARRTRYQVEAYFFVPTGLGINRHSYGREAFYSDVQAYIRFKTPRHSLEELARLDNDLPLASIHAALAGGDLTELGDRMRLLACLVRGAVRDATDGLQRLAERIGDDPAARRVLVDDLRGGVARVDDAVARLVAGVRALRPEFMHAQRSAEVRELFEYTDECISLDVELAYTALLADLDARPAVREVAGDARARLAARIVAEQAHRRQADYVTVVDSGKPDGAFVFRRSMLKKFASSVLYLELAKERDGRRISQIAAMVAAGAAMLVATMLAIWSRQVYGLDTLPFVLALVVGYMLKDRLKDWIKVYLAARSARWLPDYSGKIHDPLSGTVVGRCRESFSFLSREDVPPGVWRRRHASATSALEAQSKHESVMRYVKLVSLAGRSVSRRVARASDISDIVRFDLSRFLVRMDDAKQRVAVYDEARDKVRRAKLPRHYHLNVVLVLRAADRGVVQMERFRIVLDKSGLKALEQDDVRTSPLPERGLDPAVALSPGRA